jgi:hypothetical protein
MIQTGRFKQMNSQVKSNRSGKVLIINLQRFEPSHLVLAQHKDCTDENPDTKKEIL